MRRKRVPVALGRTALASIFIAAPVLLFPETAVAGSKSNSSTVGSTNTQPVPTSGAATSSTAGWLAFSAILLGAGLCMALIVLVSRDRRQSREKSIEALRSGAASVEQTDTPVVGALMGGAPPGTVTLDITSDHDSLSVGDTATLTATNGGTPVPCSWTFAPDGIVSANGTGPNSNLVVTALKMGTVVATAAWTNSTPPPPGGTGSKQLVVTDPRGGSISFSSLGAGIGTSVLAILAISGAIALAFEGVFTAEVGTLLGTALGAGAAGAVSAIHSGSNSNQSSGSTGTGGSAG